MDLGAGLSSLPFLIYKKGNSDYYLLPLLWELNKVFESPRTGPGTEEELNEY